MTDTQIQKNSTCTTLFNSTNTKNKKNYFRFSQTLQSKYKNNNDQNQHHFNYIQKDCWKSNAECQGKVDAFKKYSEFMNLQNNIITKVLFQTNKKFGNENRTTQLDPMSKFRQSTNQFIKSILSELTQTISKSRVLKAAAEERIKNLQEELEVEREKNRLLKQQFVVSMKQCQQKYDGLTNIMESQFGNSIIMYEQKLQQLSKKLQKEQKNNDAILQQKLQINNQFIKYKKLLKKLIHQISNRKKQFQGMKILIQQYQNQMIKYQKLINQKNEDIQMLNQKIFKIEELHQNKKIYDKAKINAILQNYIQQCNNYDVLLKKRSGKQSHTKSIKSFCSKVSEKQEQTVPNLKQQIQEAKREVVLLSQQLKEKTQNQNNLKNQIKREKLQTKQRTIKLKKLYINKQNVLKKTVVTKLKQLKVQNNNLKLYLQKQIFNFYQQSRMDFLLNNTSQSYFLTLANKHNNRQHQNMC